MFANFYARNSVMEVKLALLRGGTAIRLPSRPDAFICVFYKLDVYREGQQTLVES